MQERASFVLQVMDGTYNISELCQHFAISRKTGHKWLNRYQTGGIALDRPGKGRATLRVCVVKEGI